MVGGGVVSRGGLYGTEGVYHKSHDLLLTPIMAKLSHICRPSREVYIDFHTNQTGMSAPWAADGGVGGGGRGGGN